MEQNKKDDIQVSTKETSKKNIEIISPKNIEIISPKNIEIISPKNIEIWEDLVYIKDLMISMLICMVTTFGGYFIAPNESPKPLLFGIVGAFLGFVISSFVIKPKRELVESEGIE